MAFPIGWHRVCPLVIQQSKVSAGKLDNFPVLLTAACLPSEMVTLSGTNAAQSDGGDIRFSTDAGGQTQLPCEVVVWSQNATPANAKAEIWVKAPHVYGVYNTTIYVWYKPATTQTQPAASSTFGSQAVWSGAKYTAVYHFGSSSVLSVADSTANALNGTNTSVVAGAGQNGGGAGSFNGTSAFIDCGNNALFSPGSAPFSVSAWVNTAGGNSFGNVEFAVAKDSDTLGRSFAFGFDGSGPRLERAGSVLLSSAGALSTGTWYRLAFSYDTVRWVLYVNGTPTATATASSLPVTSGSLSLGRRNYSGSQCYLNGLLDEVRIGSIPRSSGWLTTEYNNQSSPSTFVIPGSPFAPGPYAAPGGFYRPQ